ncbi:MAG TPA: hypothetical protein VGM05_07370 [Planctomycetaceae bacterium]
MALPVLQALLLADHVYLDKDSSKFVICGVFNTLFFNEPPQPGSESTGEAAGMVRAEGESVGTAIANLMRAGSPWAYFSITELQGEKDFELRYVDLSLEPESNALFSMTLRLKCDNPLESVQSFMPLPPLPISKPEEGVYALELLCENVLLGSHRVLLKRAPQAQ